MPDEKQYYVYGLTDPRNNNEVFYVGKGTKRYKGTYARLSEHIKEADGTYPESNRFKCNKIRAILKEYLNVGFKIYGDYNTSEEALEAELKFANEVGFTGLTNSLHLIGTKSGIKTRNEAWKEKLSKSGRIAMNNMWNDPLRREQRIMTLRGRKFSDEAKKQKSEFFKKYYQIPENRAKLVAMAKKRFSKNVPCLSTSL